MTVGRGEDAEGFMSRTWDKNPADSWPPTHVAFAAWNSQVDYEFCLWEDLQSRTIIQKKHQLAIIEEWGPLFKISFDLIINSDIGSDWSSVLAFRGNGAVDDWSQYGDRAPAIFYYKTGYLHFTNAVNGNGNYHFNYEIELNKLYHIEIAQEEKNEKVGKL